MEMLFSFDGVRSDDLRMAVTEDVCLKQAEPAATWATPDYGDPVDTSRFVAGYMTYLLVEDEYAVFFLKGDIDERIERYRWLVANLHGRSVLMTCSVLLAPDGQAYRWHGECSVEDVSEKPNTFRLVRIAWSRRPYRLVDDGEFTASFPARWGLDLTAVRFAEPNGMDVLSAAVRGGRLLLTTPAGRLLETHDGYHLVEQPAQPMGPGIRVASSASLTVLWHPDGRIWASRDMGAWTQLSGMPEAIEDVAVVGTVVVAKGAGTVCRSVSMAPAASMDEECVLPFDGLLCACIARGRFVAAVEAPEGGSTMLASADGCRTWLTSQLPVRVDAMCETPSGAAAVGGGRSFMTADFANWTEGAALGEASRLYPLGDKLVAVGSTYWISEPMDEAPDEYEPIVREVVFRQDTAMPATPTVGCNYEAVLTYEGRSFRVGPGEASLPVVLGHGEHTFGIEVPYQPDVWSLLADEPKGFPDGAWWLYEEVAEKPGEWVEWSASEEMDGYWVLQNGSMVEVPDLVAVPEWGRWPVFSASDSYSRCDGYAVDFEEGMFYRKEDAVEVAFTWERGDL